MYSLLGTARLNGFEPYAWLKETLETLPFVSRQSRAWTPAACPLATPTFMDILDSLRQAPSAEMYRRFCCSKAVRYDVRNNMTG